MTDEEKQNVVRFYAEYNEYLKIAKDEMDSSDVIVDESEVPSGKHTID